MKIIYDDKIIVFVKKEQLEKIDFNDLNTLEDYFKTLFLRINKILHVKLYGYYYLKIYTDKYYGAVIVITKDKIDYFNYDQIDMQISVCETTFLYEVDDFLDFDKKYLEFYIYKNKIYAKIKKELENHMMFKLLENSKIIYKTDDILLFAKKII